MMRLKTLFATFLVLTAGTATGYGSGQDNDVRVPQFGVEVTADRFIPLPQAEVPGAQPVIVAQATNTMQLEEQIRQLMGKVEELNFQVLQLQEQMRKMQEDNEFRFQELENSKQGSVRPKDSGNDVAATPAEEQPSDPAASDAGTGAGNAAADVPASETAAGTPGVGEPPKTLGTIKFDDNGNPVGGSIEELSQLPAPEGTETAALPQGNDPAELYRISYDHVLAGEYGQAENGFRRHIEQYPTDAQTADSRYWLGESLAAQGKHREAAEILLDAQRDFPKSKKAPDMLLKLGMSLAELDNKDVACATFNQVTKKYPKAGKALLDRVAAEQGKVGC